MIKNGGRRGRLILLSSLAASALAACAGDDERQRQRVTHPLQVMGEYHFEAYLQYRALAEGVSGNGTTSMATGDANAAQEAALSQCSFRPDFFAED